MMQGTAVEAKLSGAVSAQAFRFAFYTKQACTSSHFFTVPRSYSSVGLISFPQLRRFEAYCEALTRARIPTMWLSSVEGPVSLDFLSLNFIRTHTSFGVVLRRH